MKKIEFSKIIMIYAMSINTIVVLFTLFIVWYSGYFDGGGNYNTAPLTTLIPIVGAELASGSAFYYWKARTENKLKIVLGNNEKINENTLSNVLN